jgi:hypothetical protein
MKLHRRNGLVPQLLGLVLPGLLLGLFLFATGCVISPRRLPGDVVPTSSGGSTPTPTPTPAPTPTPTPAPTPTPTPQGKLYVVSETANAILRFDNAFTATGNVAPAATISGSSTQLNVPQYLALDTALDRLFVANLGGSSILVFDQISTKNGNIAPSRTIFGPTTGLIQPSDVSYDKSRNALYVADGPDVYVFNSASNANGDVAPARDIKPGFAVSALFIDSTNDRLYLADPTANTIAIFDNASVLNGTVTATRSLLGNATTLSGPFGIQVDSAGRLVVSNSNSGVGYITVYTGAATVNGNMAPSASIAGAATTLTTPTQIVVNPSSSSGELYVANPFGGNVPVFTGYSTANGNVAPARNINGAATTLDSTGGHPTARGLALDDKR